ALDSTIEIYPGWNKRDFYAHIAGWEAMVYEVFLCHANGKPLKDYHNDFKDNDSVNAAYVAERQNGLEENIKLECDISRYAIMRMMEDIPEADFNKPIQFPWGKLTAEKFAHDAIDHEREHAADILKLQQR
nr:hypothetical protein [Anaerolineae bacterium]